MDLTKEQKEIVKAVGKYKNIKINAFAGTGKTTTLRYVAKEYKDRKILYLAFNSAIKNEASSSFPNNTYVKTTHGLAYSAIKKYTNIDLNTLRNYRAIDIANEFEIPYEKALSALKIFENFCNNTQDKISEEDTEHKTAKKMFEHMLIGVLKPTHSFYLKYYYLLISKEQIPQYQYDIIMLDEAQDTNEVTLGIFNCLNSKIKIYVGDRHQQIYSFRGSKNALDKISCDKQLYLSQSFRFNETIASYANILLRNFKNEQVDIKSYKNSTEIKSFGYISRTNAQLICIISNRIEQRKPFVTIRNPEEIFSLSIEIYYLLNNEHDQIRKNPFLKSFKDEEELADYAKQTDDFELRTALKVVKEYQERIFEFKEIAIKFYKAWQNRKSNNFEKRLEEILFLTTAHTAKGLEWDSVIVADDFPNFADLIIDMGYTTLQQYQKELKKLSNQELVDEFNLFYVALTRAKSKLVKDSENFHYLMSPKLEQLINKKISDINEEFEKNDEKIVFSKMDREELQQIKENKNIENKKARKSGLKWKLEDKIKLKSLFKKNLNINIIASKLERTPSAILGELLKSEIINKKEQNTLYKLLKNNQKASKSVLNQT
ncbi:UvrD-helicase domain-containing protein [Halarcobacter anaerophilus]|uniref:UvrD-helicase domain-containing protein n=1 Tax=Halarcobacter anaerophilus TaxID=877500 RepID=UPI0005C7F04E|nr:UvrD-helicase domain-containing protein [Halarcobacter anaerophilus]